MNQKLTNLVVALGIIVLIAGCSSTTPGIIVIKPEVIKPEVMEDTLNVTIKTDTVVIATQVIKRDTVVLIKYFPGQDRIYYRIKPDSIIVIDTVTTIREIDRVSETKDLLLQYATVVSIAIIAGLFLIIYIKISK